MTNVTHNSFYVFIFNSLHVSSTSCSSSGETNCVNTTSGSCHSVLVAVWCAGRKLPGVVLTRSVYPDDEHNVLETCKSKGLPQQAEVAQGVPGRLRPQIFLTFSTTRVVGRQPYAPAAFTPGEITGTHF